MTFRLFGVSVEIQFGFWITAFLLGYQGVEGRALLIWVAVVFLSVLIHEYGHAFAIMRHKIEPEITLHWMGGHTTWQAILPLTRPARIIVSLAGPFAGFTFAGIVYGLTRAIPVALPPMAHEAISQILWVNVGWGILNLIPVLPWDGGHVLEAALGPKRERLTAMISLTVASLITAAALYTQQIWVAFIFGLGAYRSFERLRAQPAPVHARTTAKVKTVELSGEMIALLRRARRALAEERLDEAVALASQALAGTTASGELPVPPPAPAAHEALEVIAWARLLQGRIDESVEALRAAQRIERPDVALSAAVLLAQGKRREARGLLEDARKSGDDRKEVVGPLIQILLEDGETARAAAVAFDIVESLSDDDARKMASIAFDAKAFEWAARLYEAVFARHGAADDAYDAARAHARDGQNDMAMRLLRRAVDAGFSDRARAWSDAALEALRAEHGLESVLPRP